jgi:phage terminase large subunit-like protein
LATFSGLPRDWERWPIEAKLTLLGGLRANLWRLQSNPGQLPPPEWGAGTRIWYAQGGRGSGKTRAGAEAFAELILNNPPGDYACMGPTFGDAVAMIEHRKSGLEKVLGPAASQWNRSKGELYVANGSTVYCDGADDGGERIQGKGLRGAWADEIGLWRAVKTKKGETRGGMQAWKESLAFAVRESPALIVATGTPKGNRGVVKFLRERPPGRVVFTYPSLADNRYNLEPEIVAEWEADYGGTRLGRQELEGRVLEDVEGALWTLAMIEDNRWPDLAELREALDRTQGSRRVVAVDPAISSGETSDETGIVAAARLPGDSDIVGRYVYDEDARRVPHGAVLADRSGRYSPQGWAEAAIALYHELRCDRIIYERNQGGEMVKATLHAVDPNVPLTDVWASRGKTTRAEPISALYEQNRIHHLGFFPELESEQTAWVPGEPSPSRMDGLVWALTDLFGSSLQMTAVAEPLVSAPGLTTDLLDRQM